MGRPTSVRQQRHAIARDLRARGRTWPEIASVLREQWPDLTALAATRIAHGWTQQDVADRWTAQWPDPPRSPKEIGLWENWPAGSGRRPSLPSLDRLAQLYECSVADLLTDVYDHRHLDSGGGPAYGAEDAWSNPSTTKPNLTDQTPAADSGPDSEAVDEVNRRAFLLGTTAAVTVAVLHAVGEESWQRITSTRRRHHDVSRDTVDSLQTLNTGLCTLFQPVAPHLLIGPVRAHLETLTRLLHDSSLTAAARARVTSMTAEMSILHGWLSKEDGDEVAAQHYFTAALGAAAEADNNDLGAYAAASASTLKAFRSSPHDSLQLLTTTNLRGIDMARASTATRIWIACLEAEVHTRTGSRSPALKALDRADALLHRLDPNDGQRPVLGHFDQASLMGERGVTAARLNLPSEAIPALDTALAGLAQYPKTQSRILTSTARAHLTHGDVDQATAAALQSLDIAEQTGSQVGINSIHDLRREMRPYANTTSVQLLDQRLAQI